MPRQQIPVTRPGIAGADPVEITPVAADDLYFNNDGQTLLLIRNQGGAPDTVTIVTPVTVGGLALADVAFVVANDAIESVIGPFPAALFNQTDGTVHVDVTTTNCRFRAVSTAT